MNTYDLYTNAWISMVQSAKKEFTKNLPENLKTPMDAYVDAQTEFARSAFKATQEIVQGWNQTFSDSIAAMQKSLDK